jgi:hypothetical protein
MRDRNTSSRFVKASTGALFCCATIGLQSGAQQPAGEAVVQPLQKASPSDVQMIDPKSAAAQNEPSGLSNRTPVGSGAADVIESRKIQSQATENLRKQRPPLSSTIGANAEIDIEGDEVTLGGLRGLMVEVKNTSDRPLIFFGNKSVATVSGEQIKCAQMIALEQVANPVLTPWHKLKKNTKETVVAATTVGAVPAAGYIVHQAGPILDRYGSDESRREDEISRFGKRIVWPGESTKGIVYFSTDKPLKGATIEIPVSSMFDTADQASISNKR